MLLKPLHAFVSIVKCGSFSKAARLLGLSSSSITRLLAQLEKELGFTLLERTTRRLKLTEAGALFYEKAQDILVIYDTSKEHLGGLKDILSGPIKIGAPSSLSYLQITQCVNEFLTDYPHLKIQLINGDHLLDLLENNFDFVLHCRPLPNSNFHYRPLGTWTRTLCATPAYLEKWGTPNDCDALSDHNCLLHYENKESTWPLLVDGKTKNVSISGNITTDSSLNLKNLVMNDVGIAYLPSFIIFRELQRGTLVPILSTHFLPLQNIYAVYSKNRYQTKKVKALLDFLTQKIQRQSHADSS